MRSALGMSVRSSSNRLAPSMALTKLTPVTLAPGRLRLATRPSLTGSSAVKKTMGSVVDAAFAAWADAVPIAAITDTGRRTSSVAKAGSRSS
jgi:hypothetical protein